MKPRAGALAAAAARLGWWGVVAWMPFSVLAVADRYLVGICGPASSFGGSCSAPGLGHYYELLSTVTVAGLVLVPTGLLKAAQAVRDGWRALAARS
jgi:hypothetical protein